MMATIMTSPTTTKTSRRREERGRGGRGGTPRPAQRERDHPRRPIARNALFERTHTLRKTDLDSARLPSPTYSTGVWLHCTLHATMHHHGPLNSSQVESTHFETARTSGAKLSILPSAALSLCCRISRNDRFSTRTASSYHITSRHITSYHKTQYQADTAIRPAVKHTR